MLNLVSILLIIKFLWLLLGGFFSYVFGEINLARLGTWQIG